MSAPWVPGSVSLPGVPVIVHSWVKVSFEMKASALAESPSMAPTVLKSVEYVDPVM